VKVISTPALPSQAGANAEDTGTRGPSGATDGKNGPEGTPGSVFDNLDALRQTLGAAALEGTREVLSHIPVRKPLRTEFVRVHPDPAMSLPAAVFVDREEQGEVFFVPPAMHGAMAGEIKPVLLMVGINRQDVVFLWPVPLPDASGRTNPWWDTARQAAELAKTKWVRVMSDKAMGAYRIYEPVGQIPDPVWPDMPLPEMLKIGFRGRIIDRDDHPTMKRLRGET
jgi:hypothetical protein